MAKLTLNALTSQLRGRVDNLVFKRYGDKVVVTRVPRFKKNAKPSAKQKPCRNNFRAASRYAVKVQADPALRAVYAPRAKRLHITVRSLAMSDYLTMPEIEDFNLKEFSRQGGRIGVSTADSFKVNSVLVRVRNATGRVLEEIAATKQVAGWWYAVTQIKFPPGRITIEATATDRVGHRIQQSTTVELN